MSERIFGQDDITELMMKDIHQVLREKELDILRVRKEIQSLIYVVPLLEDLDSQSSGRTLTELSENGRQNRWPLEVDSPGRSTR
jgi:hypothetical protein